jgi:hypothetical protein
VITARRLVRLGVVRELQGEATRALVRDVTAYIYENRPRCGAHARSTGRPCEARVWVRPDGTLAKRCRNHGGPSTGPKTQAGKDRSELARITGYYLWLDQKRKLEAALGASLVRRLVANGGIPAAVLRVLRARGVL